MILKQLKELEDLIRNEQCEEAEKRFQDLQDDVLLDEIDKLYFEAKLIACKIRTGRIPENQYKTVIKQLAQKQNFYACDFVLPLIIRYLDESDFEFCKSKRIYPYLLMRVRKTVDHILRNKPYDLERLYNELSTNKDLIDEDLLAPLLETLKVMGDQQYYPKFKSLLSERS